jgi:hypothetical protein
LMSHSLVAGTAERGRMSWPSSLWPDVCVWRIGSTFRGGRLRPEPSHWALGRPGTWEDQGARQRPTEDHGAKEQKAARLQCCGATGTVAVPKTERNLTLRNLLVGAFAAFLGCQVWTVMYNTHIPSTVSVTAVVCNVFTAIFRCMHCNLPPHRRYTCGQSKQAQCGATSRALLGLSDLPKFLEEPLWTWHHGHPSCRLTDRRLAKDKYYLTAQNAVLRMHVS